VRLGDWSLLTSKQPAAMGGSGRGVFALEQPRKDVLFLLSWSVLETRGAHLKCLLQSCQGRFTPCPHLAFSPPCFLRPCTQHSLWLLEQALHLRNYLLKHCQLKKYQLKSNNWIGLGIVIDSRRMIHECIVLNNCWEYDEDMEKRLTSFVTRNQKKLT